MQASDQAADQGRVEFGLVCVGRVPARLAGQHSPNGPLRAIVGGTTRDEYLRVPYVLVIESVETPGGDWHRRASYPELPGAVGATESATVAMDLADERRVSIILDRLEYGVATPVPRPPLL